MKGKITKRTGVHGVSYQMRVELTPDPVTGKRRQKFLTASTKPELEYLAGQLIASVQNGGYTEADAKKITVGEYLDRWVASIEQGTSPRNSPCLPAAGPGSTPRRGGSR